MKKKLPYTLRLFIAGFIFIFSVLAFTGIFYPLSFLDIEFSALSQRLLCNISAAAIILFSVLIIITLIFGRIYCSLFCPLGILQELAALIIYRKKNEAGKNHIFKYILSGLVFGVLIAGSVLFIRYTDPYTIFGSAISGTVFGITAVFIILTIVFFKNRFFCTNICPVGTILGLISKFSVNKIHMSKECISCGMCERNCPAACIDAGDNKIDNERCIKCFKCISVCPKDAIKYSRKPKEEVKFSIKRREVITGIAFLAALGAGFAMGINFAKNTAKKVKNIILPAGSENTERMQNTCLNCNLCIENCPNKILTKADDKFGAVHIDYRKGEKYCKYDCHKCSQVCPSGAIKKISLEEKQKTRIAMAMINENCDKCKNCVRECPTGAIVYEQDSYRVDGSKCIGCGKCKTYCPNNAIEIFAVREQSVI